MIRNQRNNQNIIMDSSTSTIQTMNSNHPSNKRRRIEKVVQVTGTDTMNVNTIASSSSQQQQSEDEIEDLYTLIESKEWAKAAVRAKQNPKEVSEYDTKREPSMLALCCRLGAPYYCIKEIVDASPTKLRHLVDARGTPLHEAIVCDDIGPKVIDYLLQVDEKLSLVREVATTTNDSNSDDSAQQQLRATIMQDVDGYTPLHLLIRRRFQSYVLTEHEQSNNNNNSENGENENENENDEKIITISGQFIEILELLVKSCPEATIIPDRGEYEEPPIVMAIKANVYAPMLLPPTQQQQQQQADNNNNEQQPGGEGVVQEITTVTRIEQHIYDMVNCMLQYYPEAASNVFNGYRGQYTALHSAVFHGRCSSTIELLLNAEKKASSDENASSKACLLGNTQGELPLHFCAMRGEPPRTVALLAKAAPEAIFQRDTSGLTPV
jgi:ankyrin repeat protein